MQLSASVATLDCCCPPCRADLGEACQQGQQGSCRVPRHNIRHNAARGTCMSSCTPCAVAACHGLTQGATCIQASAIPFAPTPRSTARCQVCTSRLPCRRQCSARATSASTSGILIAQPRWHTAADRERNLVQLENSIHTFDQKLTKPFAGPFPQCHI